VPSKDSTKPVFLGAAKTCLGHAQACLKGGGLAKHKNKLALHMSLCQWTVQFIHLCFYFPPFLSISVEISRMLFNYPARATFFWVQKGRMEYQILEFFFRGQ